MRRYLVVSLLSMALLSSATKPAVEAKSSCADTVPEVFRRVSPAVVFISAVSLDPFKVRDRLTISAGSGFIISNKGLVLTNSHLVFGHQTISVTLDGGQVTEAELVGADPILDLAVLRIPLPAKGFSVATLGDSDKVETGEEVLAVGNPFGLEQTVTVGVISGINRTLAVAPLGLKLPLIQTDAAINPGNSGGPLLNRCGEVIGMNAAALERAQGIGFSLPINVAKGVLPQLLEKGRVIRPWLGVGGKFIRKQLAEIINIPVADGFLVETIEPESPAEQANLNEGELPITIGGTEYFFGGDIIVALNGQPLTNSEDLARIAASLRVGDKVLLTLYFRGQTREVEVELAERPMLPGDF